MQVERQPCLALGTVIFMSRSLEFKRMCMRIAKFAYIHHLSTEWKSRGREFDRRRHLKSHSVVIKHPCPLQACLHTGILRANISVMILIFNPLHIVSDHCSGAAVNIVLERTLAKELPVGELTRHGKTHSETRQNRRLCKLSCILETFFG